MLNLQAFLNPNIGKKYNVISNEHALVLFAIRRLWHLIFDSIPSMLKVLGEDVNLFFENFLAWAEDKKLSMDWKLHLHLLHWAIFCSNFKENINFLHHRECILASTTRWSANHMDDRNMKSLLVCSIFSKISFVVQVSKNNNYEENTQIKICRVPHRHLPENGIYFYKSTKRNFHSKDLQWEPIIS